MLFAQTVQAIPTSVESSFLGYGVVGAVAIIAMGIAIFLYRENRSLYKQINDLQEKRIIEAEKHRDEVVEPLKQIAVQQQKIYDNSVINKSGA